jgi:hypothetical protein
VRELTSVPYLVAKFTADMGPALLQVANPSHMMEHDPFITSHLA